MAFYQNMGGTHAHTDGKSYKKGDVIESKFDLRKVWANKFEKVGEIPEGRQVFTEPKKKSKEEKKKASDAAVKDARGEDVTKQFEKALEEGFVVFKREDKYHVYEGDDTDPINKKGLSAGQVEATIEKALEE